MKPTDFDLTNGIPYLTTSNNTNSSLSYLNNAIQKVSEGRASLGAKHNALEHIISNLNNSSENLTISKSHIRDTDITKEIMNFTKTNLFSSSSFYIISIKSDTS